MTVYDSYAIDGNLGRAGAVSMVLLVLVAIATSVANRFAPQRSDRGASV